jgi:hypothetical protein
MTLRNRHADGTNASGGVTGAAGDWIPARNRRGSGENGVRMIYELMGRAHAALGREHGQGTVEYVGLILLMAVLIAGVVKASGGFSDTGIAEAVVKRLKAAIEGVGGGR